MTMAVDLESNHERGQSMLEFLIVLPLMMGLVVLMIRVNTTIQMSIVNQQYVRAQTLALTYNSPVYPRLEQRFINTEPSNEMVMGMSFKQITDGTDFVEGNKQADAPIGLVAKKGGGDDPQSEPDQRSKVRVRTSTTLCTQINTLRDKTGALNPIVNISAKNGTYVANSNFTLGEGVVFDYCAPIKGRYVDE